MEVIADLHIHSRFSIATGKEADLEHLDLWGRYKGVQVVGTGDCTHPEWLKEMAAKLEPAAPGVYELQPGLALPLKIQGPHWDRVPPVRFVITGEVSTIYKKGGQVRKVHLLLLLPSLDAAQRFSARLGRLGNVTADGRPILGLDAKYVLELALEIDPASIVIPAHIWTPWFSVLGAKSGFDSLEECFEEHTNQIHALETGLSSDPAMNWRVSALDRFLLISNSDAHSPPKLAREANIFHVPPAFPDLALAIRTKEGFGGTIEFFPQEGKYHLDGHRACNLRATPEEAAAWGGKCPQCHKPLTYGVMHRVLDLADRQPGQPPSGARPFESLIPLPEVVGQVLEVNPASKKVNHLYFRLLEKLGPELGILRRAPLTDLAREGGSLLAHGIDKMRRGQAHIAPGYDGVYGEIRLFTPEERREVQGQGAFWSPPSPAVESSQPPPAPPPGKPDESSSYKVSEPPPEIPEDPLLAGLNPAQRQAVLHAGLHLIVQAGPGTGKTRALTHRLAHLLARRGVPPEEILALTFTRQAAGEMEARIRGLLPDFPGLERLTVKTFHALGHQLLSAREDTPREVAPEDRRRQLIRQAAKQYKIPFSSLENRIILWKQNLQYPGDLEEVNEPEAAAFKDYEAALAREGLWDYEDLIARPTLLLTRQPDLQEAYRRRYRHLLVDEYQDLNAAQYRLFRALAGGQAEIMVIGDPDQAIYGFRGASPRYFAHFRQDWPDAVTLNFEETYRLPPPILEAARQVRSGAGVPPPALMTHRPGDQPLLLLERATEAAEAQAIAREIEKLVGGLSHLALEDADLRHRGPEEKAGFRDVAVLYRLHALGPELERRLTAAGIPCLLPKESLGPELDGLDLAAEKVKLLTLHAAKGLEFPYIFIAGCEAGLLPWEPEGEGYGDPEEENRLFYVGLTRASRQVFLTRARTRTLWGKKRRTLLSPLVQTLNADILQRLDESPAASRPRTRQPQLFPEIGPRPKKAR
ncbi:MAG: UvrD-helicase domain-containing protein [Deltaproteobacteria bacterium]|nr:UvrD-helicase domain-containing protein [Deltaproteobacteria bacterium]